jgi:hypothetical protein
MCGDIPPFLNTPSWRGAQLKGDLDYEGRRNFQCLSTKNDALGCVSFSLTASICLGAFICFSRGRTIKHRIRFHGLVLG